MWRKHATEGRFDRVHRESSRGEQSVAWQLRDPSHRFEIVASAAGVTICGTAAVIDPVAAEEAARIMAKAAAVSRRLASGENALTMDLD